MSTLVVERRVRSRVRVSRRGCEAAARLGMGVQQAIPDGIRGRVEVECEPGSVVLVRGVSGSGKSTLLADLAMAARRAGWVVVESSEIVVDGTRSCIELMGGDVDRAMRRLAQAGLAEGAVWLRAAEALSAGERARLEVAMALERGERAATAGRRVVVLIDALCESLDRVTARGVAASLTRAAKQMRDVCVVAASVREDLEAFLGPRRVLEVDADGNVRSRGACEVGAHVSPAIETGTIADYVRLSRWHYRGGPPATWARVLRAMVDGEVIGVLVASMPSLNASWRRTAWGEMFAGGDRGVVARRVNREVRCLSRVVVDPRWRGMGVASALVRAYLREGVTPCTEAVAAMGRFSGFFETAGMRRIELAPSARDERLRRVLEEEGLDVWRLAMHREAAMVMARDAVLEEEVRRWARASRATSRHAGGSLERLVEMAWRSIAARRAAFVHGEPSTTGEVL